MDNTLIKMPTEDSEISLNEKSEDEFEENPLNLLQISIQVLKTFGFFGGFCDEIENIYIFESLENNAKKRYIKELFGFIHLVLSFLKNGYKSVGMVTEANGKIIKSVSDSLEKLSKNSNEFIVKFHETSEDSIKLLFTLIQALVLNLRYDLLSYSGEIQKLLSALVYLSKGHAKFENNWKSIEEVTDLKLLLTSIDNSIDSKWLLFLINHNLNQTDLFLAPSFLFNQTQNFDINSKISIEFFRYLETSDYVYKSHKLDECIQYLVSYVSTHRHNDMFNIKDQQFLIDFSIKVLKQYFEETILLIEDRDIPQNNSDNSLDEDNRLEFKKNLGYNLKLILNFMKLLKKLCEISLNCSSFLHNNPDGLKALFHFISCESLLDFYVETSEPVVGEFYTIIIDLLYILSRLHYKFINEWLSCNANNVFAKFLEKVEEKFRLPICLVLINITPEEHFETSPEIKSAVKIITNLIKNCADILDDENAIVQRTKVQVNENEKELLIVSFYQGIYWNIMQLFEVLYHISVNDVLKNEIYDKYDMKNNLKTIIRKGNNNEILLALKLLSQLCSDKEIANDLIRDIEFLEYVENKSKLEINQTIKRLYQYILWNTKRLKENTPELDNKHIMISYDLDSKPICLALKAELEKSGFIVWADLENNQNIETIAESIRNSCCILVGMTEKYKLNPSCRLETEYAADLKKPIIPLILQQGYKPNGWLGVLLGSKTYVNFNEQAFEECIRQLMIEINAFGCKAVAKNLIKKISSLSIQKERQTSKNWESLTSNKYFNWKEQDVKNWMKEKNFNQNLIDYFGSSNGKILYETYSMISQVPDISYSKIQADSLNKVSLKDLGQFYFELKNLFGDD